MAGVYLGYDDFFAEYFHGIVYSCGLLLDKNDLSKSPLTKQFQVLKVVHCLKEMKDPGVRPMKSFIIKN